MVDDYDMILRDGTCACLGGSLKAGVYLVERVCHLFVLLRRYLALFTALKHSLLCVVSTVYVHWHMTPCVVECCELKRSIPEKQKDIQFVDLVTSWFAQSVQSPLGDSLGDLREQPTALDVCGWQAGHCLHLSADTTPL